MKYKPLDKVRIKSLDWYNMHCDDAGNVDCGCEIFEKDMKPYLGKVFTIHRIVDNSKYEMEEAFDFFLFTDEMIEGLVEEETKPKFKVGDKVKDKNNRVWFIVQVGKTFFDISRVPNASDGSDVSGYFVPIDDQDDYELVPQNDIEMNGIKLDTGYDYLKHEISLPDGYIFKDENGNVINATKIVLEKKKKEYPKTYCECKDILGLWDIDDTERGYYKTDLIDKLQMLLICRDTYWKIAGEEMGLGKPWEPDWNNISDKYCIYFVSGDAWSKECQTRQCPFAFPTPEMRDAFYENFKELIEQCKELL